jgi:hypothetical protein
MHQSRVTVIPHILKCYSHRIAPTSTRVCVGRGRVGRTSQRAIHAARTVGRPKTALTTEHRAYGAPCGAVQRCERAGSAEAPARAVWLADTKQSPSGNRVLGKLGS